MHSPVFTLLLSEIPNSNSGLWNTKEVLLAIGAVIGSAIPVVLFLIRHFCRSSEEAKIKALSELSETQKELERARTELHQVTAASQALNQKLSQAESLLTDEQKAACDLAANNLHLQDRLEEAVDGHASAVEDLRAKTRLVERMSKKDGRSWMEPVRSSARTWEELDPDRRRVPVISVLNLKGGVGKTSTTANLGAAFAQRGYRVLLIDLDLQGSLTSLFFKDGEIANMQAEEQPMLAEFFEASFSAEFPKLHEYARPILAPSRSGLVPTTDALAYAEQNLAFRWLLREGNRDPRLLLCRELQLHRTLDRYDVVLLDCPPVLNISCINALAASDYVLVPVMLTRQCTDRIPVLLNRRN